MLHPREYAAALLVGVLMCVIELTAARNHALAMVFITPLSLTLVDATGPPLPVLPTTGSLLADTTIGCAAAVAVGQFVTTKWIDRQCFYAVNGVLKAAAATLDDHGRIAELNHAHGRMALMRQRMMGERRGVRTAAAAWQELLKQADEVGAQVLTIVDGQPADTEETAAEIQRLRELTQPRWPEKA